METLIETFHLDWRLFLAQVINFGIVFVALYFLVLKSLLKTMKERSSKIETSLAQADEIELQIKATEEKNKAILDEAKREAAELMNNAVKKADEKREAMIARAKEDIGVIINQEKESMQKEKERVLKEIKKETAEMVVASLEKVLGDKMNEKIDKSLIEESLK